MKKSRRIPGAIALAVVLVVSCKSDGLGTVSDFCAEYAAAICQVAPVCGTSTASCLPYQQGRCATMTGQAVDNWRRYAPQNAPACINLLKAAYGSSAPIAPATLARIDRACQYVYQGTEGLGGTCDTDYDCAGPTDGSVICDAYTSSCAVKKVIGGGQAWTAAGDVCATNFYLSVIGPGGACTAAGTSAAASACNALDPCDSDSRCVYPDTAGFPPGVCMPLLGAGQWCGWDSDCSPAAPYCDHEQYPPACTAGLQFGPGAASCDCVAGPCAGTGGSDGLGGSSGSGGGTAGVGGSAGVGGTAAAGGSSG